MKHAGGVGAAAVVGFVSYLLGLGFEIPPGGEGFHFFATFSAIAGFGVGSVLAKRESLYRMKWLGISILVDLFVGISAAVAYMLLLSMGAAPGIWLMVVLSFLITVTFFCLGAVLPLAGMSFGV